MLLTGLFALFFSKDMADDLGIGRETFYNDVREGKWTIDKFFGYAKQALRDMNGNGTVDEGDIFGIAMTNNTFFVDFFTNSKARFIDKDKDDIPYLSVVRNTRFSDIYDKVIANSCSDERMLFNTTITPLSDANGKDNLSQTLMLFGSGHSLFAGTTMSRAGTLRSYDLDFGIIPFRPATKRSRARHTPDAQIRSFRMSFRRRTQTSTAPEFCLRHSPARDTNRFSRPIIMLFSARRRPATRLR